MLTAEARAKLQTPSILIRLLLSLGLLLFVLNRMSKFLAQIEMRPGVHLADPILKAIPPTDFTWLSFSLIYGGLVFAIAHLFRHPERLILALQGYSIMVTFRAIAMFLLPLEAPLDIIVLKDPFVEFFGSAGIPLTRDLFFSGHTSTMALIGFASTNPRIRVIFLFSTAAIGMCVLAQHVHYSIDVMAAPFFAYGSMRLAGWLNLTARRLSATKQ